MRPAILLYVFLVFPTMALSATLHVPGDYPTIQAAIQAAASGDTILVAPDTYMEQIDYLNKDLNIVSEEGPEKTAIDGSGIGRVVTMAGVPGTPTLEGFTITHGYGERGAGIYCIGSNPLIQDCMITYNRTRDGSSTTDGGDGAGIYANNASSPTIQDCTIAYNVTGDGGDWFATNGGSGGGIYCYSATLINCTLTQNTTGKGGDAFGTGNGGDPGNGGGIYIESDSPRIENCTITLNQTGQGGSGYWYGEPGGDGAGIFATPTASPEILNCFVAENVAGQGGHGSSHPGSSGGDGGRGGGIFLSSGQIRGCRMQDNAAGEGGWGESFIGHDGDGGDGGGIYSAEALLESCEVIDNKSGQGGNNPFAGNSGKGGKGAGLYTTDLTLVINCTFVGNETGRKGGTGEYNVGGGVLGDTVQITNTIFWDNTPDQVFGTNPQVTYSDIQAGSGEPWYDPKKCIEEDPIFVDPVNGDYHLSWISPCINRGTNAEAPTGDIDGDIRPSMGTVDMGSDEFIGVHPLAADRFSLPHNTSQDIVNFALDAGEDNGNRVYLILCSVTGTMPGLSLGGGQVIFPINWDIVTEYVLCHLFAPNFGEFLGTLDPIGRASAYFEPMGILTGMYGLTMSFAYGMNNPWDFVSNPINVEILP